MWTSVEPSKAVYKNGEEILPDHFLMGPSSAQIWSECPGSLRIVHPTEEELGWDTSKANRGTLGHKMVEAQLEAFNNDCTNFKYDYWLPPGVYGYLQSFSPEAKSILTEAVVMCFSYIMDLIANRYTIQSELKIPDDFLVEHGGTIDIVALKFDGDLPTEMEVVDFKFGQRGVTIENNKQVMSYINLARQQFGTPSVIRGTIIQPAIGGVMTKEFSIEELDEWASRTMWASASNDFKAGTHCEFCPLRAMCPTHGDYMKRQCRDDFPNLTEAAAKIGKMPTEAEAEMLSKMYRTGKIAEKVCADASTLIKRYYNRGYDFTPYDVDVRKTVRMNWVGEDPRECAEVIATEYNLDCHQYIGEPAIISPAVMCGLTGLSLTEFREKYASQLDLREVQNMHTGKIGIKDLPEFTNLTSTES